MKAPGEMPPTRTIEREATPPDSGDSTSAQLKADINSGATGDKVGAFDPGLSPLGTDDEAAGTPPSAKRVNMARHFEKVRRWSNGGRANKPSHEWRDVGAYSFIGAVTLIGVILVVGVAWVR